MCVCIYIYILVRLPDTNFHKKTAYYEDFMKLSVIEGNTYGFNLRRGAHSSGHYFQDGRHCLKWPPFFDVRKLKIIEITNFNILVSIHMFLTTLNLNIGFLISKI